MTFKKVHRRADTFHRRQVPTLVPPISQTSTTRTTSSVPTWRGPMEPTGPPLYITTSTQSSQSQSSTVSGSTTTSQTVSIHTVSSTPTANLSTEEEEPTTSAPLYSAPRNTVTRVVTTSRATASVAPVETESDGMSVGAMGGIAAGVIVAIGLASIFIVWLMRRKRKNEDIDEMPFNRNSFLRNSTVIPDDEPLPPRSRPTPGPDMAERQLTPMYGGTPTFDTNQNGFGYQTQPSYQQGQMYSSNSFGPGGAPATPLPHSPGFGTAYDQPGYNTGGYAELTRGGPHDYPPSPQYPHSPSYSGHETFPSNNGHDVVYNKQVNYPELSPAPATAHQGYVVAGNNSVHDGRETPVQLGFVPAQAHQPAGAPAHDRGKPTRPETVYNDNDAYGGM